MSVVPLPAIKAALALLKTAFGKYDLVFKKIAKSAETSPFIAADELRDRITTAMFAYVRSMLKHFDDTTADAARRIMIILDTFGNPSNKGFSAQSSITNNMLQELQKLENAGYITLLGIEPWMQKLEDAQREFERIEAFRGEDKAMKDLETNATIERKNTHEEYLKFVEIYNAHLLLSPSNELIEIAKKANELIDRQAHRIAQRQGVAETKKKKEQGEK